MSVALLATAARAAAAQPATRPAVGGGREVDLPCDLVAEREVRLYPRVSGTLAKWSVDVGQPVNRGDVIAVIASPETDAQLHVAQAAVEQAKANLVKADVDADVARRTVKRYAEANKQAPGTVSPDDVAVYQGVARAAEASQATCRAGVGQAVVGLDQAKLAVDAERIIAPFGGVVTARHCDAGDVVNADLTGAGRPLFEVMQVAELRVFVNVPQPDAMRVAVGTEARLAVSTSPGKTFACRVVALAATIDPTSRTRRVELAVPNPNGELLPGEWGHVRLPLMPAPTTGPAATVPAAPTGSPDVYVGTDGQTYVTGRSPTTAP